MKTNNLTIKQEKFCQAYIRLGDKSAAYREVYDAQKMKPETVNENASRLTSNSKIAARVKELQASVAKIADKKFNITSETMLRHLNILREARIDDYVVLKDNGDVTFKPFSELSPEQLMCIEGIKQTKFGIELKLHGKEWCIEKINKHIGFYERDNQQKTPMLTGIKVEIVKPDENM